MRLELGGGVKDYVCVCKCNGDKGRCCVVGVGCAEGDTARWRGGETCCHGGRGCIFLGTVAVQGFSECWLPVGRERKISVGCGPGREGGQRRGQRAGAGGRVVRAVFFAGPGRVRVQAQARSGIGFRPTPWSAPWSVWRARVPECPGCQGRQRGLVCRICFSTSTWTGPGLCTGPGRCGVRQLARPGCRSRFGRGRCEVARVVPCGLCARAGGADCRVCQVPYRVAALLWDRWGV